MAVLSRTWVVVVVVVVEMKNRRKRSYRAIFNVVNLTTDVPPIRHATLDSN